MTEAEDEGKSHEAVLRIYQLVAQTFSVEVPYWSGKSKYWLHTQVSIFAELMPCKSNRTEDSQQEIFFTNLCVLIWVFWSRHANRIWTAQSVSSSKYPVMEYKTFSCYFQGSI